MLRGKSCSAHYVQNVRGAGIVLVGGQGEVTGRYVRVRVVNAGIGGRHSCGGGMSAPVQVGTLPLSGKRLHMACARIALQMH